jgi:tetratricopeptide (TPR) repeat protein/tRNA A-37 threonylcarbamoyl transferase component Bud32
VHGAGGLGKVFVALDDDLHREVALKTIRSRHLDSPESQHRFLREAEITAGLEHPGIVPIYGLGSDANGRPFYAMRLIRGSTLKEAIDRFHERPGAGSSARTSGEKKLELLKLLERFIAVCNTVAYAHSRGILHRDLKPSNVMLGAYGETLILDWGLAKPMDQSRIGPDPENRPVAPLPHDDALLTGVGGILGTPAYMSPEQAEGRGDELGPASDVFSLGATLYTLLTGRAPFEGSLVAEILHRVRDGRFARPTRVNPRIPRPLEMICLKAMSLNREARYASARELAEDIERWIAGEPVTAWREGLFQRLRRWSRHHRSALVAALCVLVSSAASLAAFSVLEATHKEHLRVAEGWTQAEGKLARAEDRLGAVYRLLGRTDDSATHYASARDAWQRLATRDTKVAEYGRALAESRRQLDSLLIRPVPGGSGADGPDHQASLARSYQRLGVVQGETGDREGAAESFRRAIVIYTELSLARPEVPAYLHSLATTYTNLGAVQDEPVHRREAAESYHRASLIGLELVASRPDDPECLDVLARSYRRLGVVQKQLGQPSDAEVSARKAVTIATTLADAHPDATDYASLLGNTFDDLGAALAAQGKHVEAERAYRLAIGRQRIALEQSPPDVTEFRQCLSSHYAGFARVMRAQGQADEAVQAARQRRKLWENPSGEPNNPNELYMAACDLAVCVPMARDEARQQALASEAIATLRAAVAAGWCNAAQTGRDPDLIPLRHRDDFRRILDEMFDRSFPSDPFRQ